MKRLTQLHKWLGLIIAVQLLLWLISGFTLSLIDFNKSGGRIYQKNIIHPSTQFPDAFIHQEHLSRIITDRFISDKVDTIKLVNLHGGWFYQVQLANRVKLFESLSGDIAYFDKAFAIETAQASYVGSGKLTSVDELPEGTLSRWGDDGKLWQVSFDDDLATNVIISQSTGKVLRHRNLYTDVSELMFTLHFMDYQKQHSFNHLWIILFASLAVAFSLSGTVLLFRHYRRSYQRIVT